MQRFASVLTCAVLGFTFSAGALPASSAADTAVVGVALTDLEIPGQVSAVLWTRRTDRITLQINRRTAEEYQRQLATARNPDSLRAVQDEVRIWLLRADGTHIAPTGRSERSESSKGRCDARNLRCLGYQIYYAFPLAAGEEAVAVAMQFNDQFLIQKLPRLQGT